MASTIINVPGLPSGVTASVRIRNKTTAALEATIALSETAGLYSGTVTEALADYFDFEILYSGTVSESRRCNIYDDVGPYSIVQKTEPVNAGVGPYSVVIEIQNDADDSPIQNASIRLNDGVSDFTGLTDAYGLKTFGLFAGSYSVVVARLGFTSYTGTLVVSADATPVIQLTPSGSVTLPTDPLLSTGLMKVLNQFGAAESDVPITVQLTAGPGTAGYAYDTLPWEETSDDNGEVAFVGLVRGATYKIYRGAAPGSSANSFASRSASSTGSFVVPDSSSFNMAEIIGLDA